MVLVDVDAIREQYSTIRDIPQDPLPHEKVHAGSAGRLLEHLFGVNENNIPGPDYRGWEFKTKNSSVQNADSLFTLKPTFPLGGDSYMRETYGIHDPPDRSDEKPVFPEHKILNTSLKANRDNPVFKNFGHPDGKWLMRLLVDREAEKLKLKVSYTDGTEFDERVYWDFCCLKKRFEEKLRYQIAFSWEKKEINGEVKFIYRDAIAYLDGSWEMFLQGIETENVQYDHRLGIYRSGKSKGKLHNHGGAFRLVSGRKDYLKSLYSSIENL